MKLNLQKFIRELEPYRQLHLATLKNLGFGFAYLITTEELIKMLKPS
jgi:hypothetical protein